MSYQAETPFDSIEGSHEYVALLAEALDEARRDVEAQVAAAERDGADRRKQALLLVSYNLAKLNMHITNSRRILKTWELPAFRLCLPTRYALYPVRKAPLTNSMWTSALRRSQITSCRAPI